MKTLYACLLIVFSFLASGCASVEMASIEESERAKLFAPPPSGKSGVYIYRNSFMGKALKKNIWIDGQCLGESAPDMFFYTQVEGGRKHVIETESEFSPNALELMFEAGKNYFIRQYIKLGVFIGGANLEKVSEEQGREDVKKLQLARITYCNRSSHINSAVTTNDAPTILSPPTTLPPQNSSLQTRESLAPPRPINGGPKIGAPQNIETSNIGTRPDLYFPRASNGAAGKPQ